MQVSGVKNIQQYLIRGPGRQPIISSILSQKRSAPEKTRSGPHHERSTGRNTRHLTHFTQIWRKDMLDKKKKVTQSDSTGRADCDIIMRFQIHGNLFLLFQYQKIQKNSSLEYSLSFSCLVLSPAIAYHKSRQCKPSQIWP